MGKGKPAAKRRQPEPGGTVMVAWVHSDQVAHSWFTSIMGAVLSTPQIGPYIAMRYGSDGLPAARNKVAEQFLASGAEWLWVVDTDMGFAPDTLTRLLEVADPTDRPMVGALCFTNREVQSDGMGGYRCTAVPAMYRWAEDADGRSGFTPLYDYPPDTVVQVAGTGSACVLIHRGALERVEERDGPSWYTRLMNPSTGQLLGEDLSFCARLAQCGIPVHVDTSVKTTHLKPIWLQELDYERGDDRGQDQPGEA